MNIEQIKKILPNLTPGYFATKNGEQLEIRGWQYQFSEGNKFYFTTSNTKDVYTQMQDNLQVAFACEVNEYNIRISGKATFLTDIAKKEQAFAKISSHVQAMYQKASNPTFEVFYIGSGEIKVNKGFEPFKTVKF